MMGKRVRRKQSGSNERAGTRGGTDCVRGDIRF